MTAKASYVAPSCSFCGKAQREVLILIAGPAVQICNECVGLCAEIVAERHMDTPGHTEHDVLTAALPYLERMGEPPSVPPMRSCEPKGVRVASLVMNRLAELRKSGTEGGTEVVELGGKVAR